LRGLPIVPAGSATRYADLRRRRPLEPAEASGTPACGPPTAMGRLMDRLAANADPVAVETLAQ
jgi:hypothetical protein